MRVWLYGYVTRSAAPLGLNLGPAYPFPYLIASTLHSVALGAIYIILISH